MSEDDPRSKPIPLTAQGHAAFEAELDHLVTVERPVIVKRVAQARDEGDLSENFAYHDARRELGLLDGRVETIRATLRNAVLIEAPSSGGSMVELGSTVVVRDEFGETTYLMVGPAEADIAHGKLSMASPMGSVLMGRGAGDSVEFAAPAGKRQATVVSISA